MNSLSCWSVSFEAGVKLLPFWWDSSLCSASPLCWYTQQLSVWCNPGCYRYGWVAEEKAGADTEDHDQGDSHLRWTCVFYWFCLDFARVIKICRIPSEECKCQVALLLFLMGLMWSGAITGTWKVWQFHSYFPSYFNNFCPVLPQPAMSDWL